MNEAAGADLKDYNRLVNNTQKKMTILSQTSEKTKAQQQQAEIDEKADEFLRNFFIKFGMRKTLESFQQEWYELKAKNELDTSCLPEIPEIYRKNAELSDELAVL